MEEKRAAPAKGTRTEASEPVYSKEKLLGMRRYRARRDLLEALLADGHAYTRAQADERISAFMKGRVD